MGRFVPRKGAVEELRLSRDVQAELHRAARIGAIGAARRAPVDTGRLKASIDAESIPGEARFGTDVDYGLYQEVGTSRMAAQPYLRPALDDIKADLS